MEVVVTKPSQVTFMSLFGFGAPTVPARAVAWAGADSEYCFHVLEDVDQDAFDTQSRSVLNAPSCSLMVNSCDSWAGNLTSNSLATVSSASFCGGYVEQSNADLVATSGYGPYTSVPPAPDPMAWIPPPAGGSIVGGPPAMPNTPWGSTNYGCDYVDMEYDTPSVTLDPGVYCGKFTLKNATNATLNPGMYIMQGGPMKIEGDSVIQGSGVTFYFTHSGSYDFEPFSFSSNALGNLSAPTSPCTTGGAGPNWPNGCAKSGPGSEYYGILFYANPYSGSYDDEFTFESNTGAHTLNGSIYFPNHVLNVESSAVIDSNYLIMVVRRYIAESNSVVNVGTTYPAGLGSPLKRVALVE